MDGWILEMDVEMMPRDMYVHSWCAGRGEVVYAMKRKEEKREEEERKGGKLESEWSYMCFCR